MVEYIMTLSDEDAAKVGKKADELGIVDDLDYLTDKFIEWLNIDDSARLKHCEK